MSYQVMFVEDSVRGYANGGPQELPNATELMNKMAIDRWRVISVAPGTNAQSHGGLFITFERA